MVRVDGYAANRSHGGDHKILYNMHFHAHKSHIQFYNNWDAGNMDGGQKQ
jgi:hypothetical protein